MEMSLESGSVAEPRVCGHLKYLEVLQRTD